MIEKSVEWLLYSVLGLGHDRWVESLEFFLYDSIKIILLLFVMIALIGFLRTYLSRKRIRRWMSGKYGTGNIAASLFGSITPFCSCSSIPIFLSFVRGGVPLGVCFSFLITSPIVNQYLVVLMLGFFSWKITVAYVLSGILIGTITGMFLGRMGLEKHIVRDIVKKRVTDRVYNSIKDRLKFGWDEAVSITKKLWYWILLGVGIGAIIHNYIPSEVIQSLIDKGGVFSVPLAVLLGIPIYGSCAAIVPIAVVLFEKGVPIGTALAFMMAVASLSLPEAIILRRAMNLKLIGIYFAIVGLAIVLTGYFLNAIQIIL